MTVATPVCPPTRPKWVMTVPVISTAHLTAKNRYDPPIDDDELYGLLAVPLLGGLMVHVGEDYAHDPDMPEDLVKAAQWAQDLGYEWLRFDCDGDVIADLPIYDDD